MSKEFDLTEWKWNGKVALIFGISGQDGSYLSELLLSKGYKVRGVIRRSSSPNTSRIYHLDKFDDIYGKTPESPFYMQYGDLGDATSIRTMIEEVQPDEIYNLGAQSHVGISFRNPESTINFNALGTLRILEAIKEMKLDCKYYQASSSEMFGISPPPQNEDTKMLPQSPYGIAKLAAYHLTKMYRKAYGLFACNGILFNHESPRRGLNFVTKKITVGISKILFEEEKELVLGNLEAKRDWGFSKEYVEGIWKILQHDEPDDFVLATRETHSIKEFLEEAFKLLNLNWEDFVKNNDRYRRPSDVPALLGDPSKAEKILYWQPKTKFKDLVKMMLAADIKYMMKEHGILRKEDENQEDDFFIEKGKELGKNLTQKVKKDKVEKIFEDLDNLEGHFPREVLESIKQGLNKS